MAHIYNWKRSLGGQSQSTAPLSGRSAIQMYYEKHFPYDVFRIWNKAPSNSEHIKQELALISSGIYVERHFIVQSDDWSDVDRFVKSRRIDRIDIGPWVDSQGAAVCQKLAFDLDVQDYELVYPGEGATVEEGDGLIKKGAWHMIALSMGYLGYYIQQLELVNPNLIATKDSSKSYTSFWSDYTFVFSGRRGAHMWCNKFNRDWMNQRDVNQLCEQYIPLLQTAQGAFSAYQLLKKDAADVEWLQKVDEYGRAALNSDYLWERGQATTSYLTRELSTLLGRTITPTKEFFEALEAETLQITSTNDDSMDVESSPLVEFWIQAGLLLLAPRIDKNVTTSSNHLLKAPFVVHPETHLIALPFNPYTEKALVRDNICIPVTDLVNSTPSTPQVMDTFKESLDVIEGSHIALIHLVYKH